MTTIVTRSGKAAPLTHAEMDANLTNLNTDKAELIDLASTASGKGAALVGFIQSGTGAVARSALAKMCDVVSVKDFGALGDGSNDDTAEIQAAITTNKAVFFPKPSSFYKITSPLTVSSHATLIFEDEETEVRLTSGTGYVIECDGGTVEATGEKHIRLIGGTLSGSGNASCDGGLKIKGAYVVHIDHMHCRLFSKSTAIACLLENVFNCAVTNSRFNCGSSSADIQGDIGLKITITSASEWNVTQVTLNNNLMQFNTRYGVQITREGSTGAIDGVSIFNNGIGHNSTAGIIINSDEIFGVNICDNHIEGTSTHGVNVVNSSTVVSVERNKFQDAATAIYHNGKGRIGENKITSGSLSGSGARVGVSIGASAIVKIGENDIDSVWVTSAANRYVKASGGRTDFGIIQTTTANFSSLYSANAAAYQGTLLIQTDATDYSLRFLMAYGSSWYRLVPRFSDIINISGTSPNIGGGGQVFLTGNGGAINMSSMPGGYTGQEVTVIFGDSNTTVDFTGTTLKGNNGSDWTPATNDFMRCVYDGTNWLCQITEV